MLNDVLIGAGAGLLYGVVGTILMMLGYLLVDVLTPGKLSQVIWVERNRNAALVLSANLLGVGAVVTTAILASADTLAAGLLSTAAYGIVGLILMGLAFVAVNVLTPGDLGQLVVDEQPHPTAWVIGCTNLAIAAIVAAAIS